MTPRAVTLRDSTLREGFDTPGFALERAHGTQVLFALADAGVSEAEVVAPARVREDLVLARAAKDAGVPLRLTGLVYASRDDALAQLDDAGRVLDRVDWIVPLSAHREPRAVEGKRALVARVLAHRPASKVAVGVGFPHCTQVDAGFVVEMCALAQAEGADRVTVYDTNGSGEPFGVARLVEAVTREVSIPVLFHGHDDLGLATANSWAAVRGGARCIDVTVNGLGDRAGNTSLEQLAMVLGIHGIETGIDPAKLRSLSRLVARLGGIAVSPFAPVVGEHVFDHESASHLKIPGEFEAFAPDAVGATRRIGNGRADG